jgi:hypothetical protein
MAFQVINKMADSYIGLSGDVKPTKGISAGAEFIEVDTGAKYVWFNGAWVEDLTLIYAMQQVMEQ